MIEGRDLDDREMFRFYGRPTVAPLKGYAARDGFRTVALGGLAVDDEGRVWGFTDFRPGYRLKAIYRYMRRLLAWAEESGVPEIRVSRDRSYDTSERLLSRAGFERCEEIEGHEIWAWRNTKVMKNG